MKKIDSSPASEETARIQSNTTRLCDEDRSRTNENRRAVAFDSRREGHHEAVDHRAYSVFLAALVHLRQCHNPEKEKFERLAKREFSPAAENSNTCDYCFNTAGEKLWENIFTEEWNYHPQNLKSQNPSLKAKKAGRVDNICI